MWRAAFFLVGMAALPGVLAQTPFRITKMQVLTNGEAALELSVPTGGYYRLDVSTNLVDWDGWLTAVPARVNQHGDAAAPYLPRRYYRAAQVPLGSTLTGDHVPAASGELILHPVNHASLLMSWNDLVIYADPVGSSSLYQSFPRADLILVTHEHGDHFSSATLQAVAATNAVLIVSQAVYNGLSAALRLQAFVLRNGASMNALGILVEAVPAYNLSVSNHPKGVGNGYVLTLGERRIYISGDTEDVPEVRSLREIDVAVLCMNVPYTMTVAKAAQTVRAFRPRIVIPYHFRNQDGTFSDLASFKRQVGTDLGIEVRPRVWY